MCSTPVAVQLRHSFLYDELSRCSLQGRCFPVEGDHHLISYLTGRKSCMCPPPWLSSYACYSDSLYTCPKGSRVCVSDSAYVYCALLSASWLLTSIIRKLGHAMEEGWHKQGYSYHEPMNGCPWPSPKVGFLASKHIACLFPLHFGNEPPFLRCIMVEIVLSRHGI
jgi:hypothetical protein